MKLIGENLRKFNNRIVRKPPKTWRVKKKTLRNNMWVKEGISRQILRYFELNGQFSLQSQRKAMPKNVQTTTQLFSFNMLVR